MPVEYRRSEPVMDWDFPQREYARFIAQHIDDLEIFTLLNCQDIAQMTEKLESIASKIYKEDPEHDEPFGNFTLPKNTDLNAEMLFWAFMHECRMELEAVGIVYDSIGLSNVADKVQRWVH